MNDYNEQRCVFGSFWSGFSFRIGFTSVRIFLRGEFFQWFSAAISKLLFKGVVLISASLAVNGLPACPCSCQHEALVLQKKSLTFFCEFNRPKKKKKSGISLTVAFHSVLFCGRNFLPDLVEDALALQSSSPALGVIRQPPVSTQGFYGNNF